MVHGVDGSVLAARRQSWWQDRRGFYLAQNDIQRQLTCHHLNITKYYAKHETGVLKLILLVSVHVMLRFIQFNSMLYFPLRRGFLEQYMYTI